MPLRPYAMDPLRCSLQLCADALVLAWTAGWVWLAHLVHDGILVLASAGFTLQDGAGGLESGLNRARDGVHRTPWAGGTLAAPFDAAGSAAGKVADAGLAFGDGLRSAALPVAVALALLGSLPIALPWLAVRWRYARRAGATQVLLRQPGGQRLLALRAMAGRPPTTLLAVHPDPVLAWEDGDPEITAALAALELRALGLRRAALRTG
ncbi:MAG TPA: hypothetical protein VI248_20960 [Kineosporiaceae bacterium]